jgi:hypothetical protein
VRRGRIDRSTGFLAHQVSAVYHRREVTHVMPHGLIVVGAVLVVVVGIVMYFLMRRDEPPEPPHFGG